MLMISTELLASLHCAIELSSYRLRAARDNFLAARCFYGQVRTRSTPSVSSLKPEMVGTS